MVELGAAWAIRRTAAPGVETAADPMGDRVRSLQLTLWPFRQRHPLGRSEAAPGQSAADSSFGDSKFSDSRLDPLQAGLDLAACDSKAQGIGGELEIFIEVLLWSHVRVTGLCLETISGIL